MTTTTPHIIPIALPLANAYLVQGTRWVLVDSGAPGDGGALLRALQHHGIAPSELSLILLTHGHVDHFGGAAAVHAHTNAPIAVHRADADNLRLGRNPSLVTLGVEGRIFRPFLPWSATPVEPHIVFDDAFDLRSYGLEATIIPTPGHSPGSVSLLLAGGALIAGDLLRGGFVGGRVRGGYPNPPFYADNPQQLWSSVATVLQLPLTSIYVGHGGPLSAAAVHQRYSQLVSTNRTRNIKQ